MPLSRLSLQRAYDAAQGNHDREVAQAAVAPIPVPVVLLGASGLP